MVAHCRGDHRGRRAVHIGTEFGLELLQLAYATAQAIDGGVAAAYKAVFGAQLLAAILVPAALVLAVRRGLPVTH